MALFNPSALDRARRCLEAAQRNLGQVQRDCTLAKVSLEDAGRHSEAKAVEMVCASAEQLERDIIHWKKMTEQTRENHYG